MKRGTSSAGLVSPAWQIPPNGALFGVRAQPIRGARRIRGNRWCDEVRPRALAAMRPPRAAADTLKTNLRAIRGHETPAQLLLAGMITRFPGDRRLGFLEISAGCASLSAAAAEAGFRVLPPIDIEFGPHGNVLDRKVLSGILTAIQSGEVRWCIWVHHALRSAASS